MYTMLCTTHVYNVMYHTCIQCYVPHMYNGRLPESVRFLLVKLCPLPKVSIVVVSVKEKEEWGGGGGEWKEKEGE